MDKFLVIGAAVAIALGVLLIPRTARASTMSEETPASEPDIAVPQSSSPKGIVNNNPFNIEFRASINWRGQLGTDGRFAVFDTPVNGIRAGMINIHTKFERDGANTVRRLLNILSPSFENPTENFITFVSQKIRKAPDEPLEFFTVIIPLSQAIITFENGEQPYTFAQFQEALRESNKS